MFKILELKIFCCDFEEYFGILKFFEILKFLVIFKNILKFFENFKIVFM